MKQIKLSWHDVQGQCLEIVRQIQQDGWMPDYVVGITRGGCIPAVLISQYLGVRCEMLKVSLRDGGDTESNLWMAEDAFGYVNFEDRGDSVVQSKDKNRKKILIVDDINDSGRTLQWIMDDWQSSCCASATEVWQSVWNQNVKFAVLVNNTASKFEVNYQGLEINKAEEDSWIVYPWEQWWA